jgi:hypothetical protein
MARLIAADYAEQVVGAETDRTAMQLVHLGLETSRAFALGKATAADLEAVRRALSRVYGADFARIARLGGAAEAEIPAYEADLSDLARRLGVFGFPAGPAGTTVGHADEKLHLSVSSGMAGAFVGKATACACAVEPKPLLAAQYARAAWKNRQTTTGLPGASLGMGVPGGNVLGPMRAGRSSIAGARSGAELIDSQIELAGHYAYGGPVRHVEQAPVSGSS